MARIVLIEDDSQTSRLAVKLLHKRGHYVESFQTGEEGLMALFCKVPNLILVDLGLPDIDGQTVISLIRQQATLRSTLLITFTAWAPDVAQNMAQAYGCDGVIVKPINTHLFVQQIEGFLEKVP